MAEQIGEYNRLIEIWKRSGAVDAAGEPVVADWVFYKRKWAKIRGRNGIAAIREMASASGKEVQAPLDLESYRVRYCEDITEDMQIRYRGRALDIVLVRPDTADREFTDLVVRKGASGG